MCSWCWGFAPVLERVRAELAGEAAYDLILGGLAPDSEEPMTVETRAYVQGAWDAVEARTGARFNRAYWTECEPRRSTWPACRAVIAAGRQGADEAMFGRIQRVFYLEARDPSWSSTLVELADELNLDVSLFEADLESEPVAERFASDLERRAALGVTGLPTLLLTAPGADPVVLARGYHEPVPILERARAVLAR